MTDGESEQTVHTVMEEFINYCDEYVFCIAFATKGIEEESKKIIKTSGDERIWIATVDQIGNDHKFHARMEQNDFIEKSKKNGHFSNELIKLTICAIYCLWDEVFRHRVSDVIGIKAENIVCPLMGDLRKIRHCILHHKSIIPDKGITFEKLEWSLLPGKLDITYEMFLALNDGIRGNKMAFGAWRLAPEIEELLPLMTVKERKSFDEHYKVRDNKLNNIQWPGLEKFFERTKKGDIPPWNS